MDAISKNISEMIELTEQHIAADAVVQGHYWKDAQNDVGGNGCFIGCLTHGSNENDVVRKFGLPAPLVNICEDIFEALPESKAKQFFLYIPNAIGEDGKDLSLIHWKFLAAELRAMPDQGLEIQHVVDPVIDGMDLLADGKEWPAAASYAAAARSDYTAAYTATTAARAAAAARADHTASYVAAAAAAAAYAAPADRQRQAATIIELLKSAERVTN